MPEGAGAATRTRAFLAAGLAFLLAAGPIHAIAAVSMGSAPAAATAGEIAVADGVARAMPAGASDGDGSLTITNRASEPDRMTALSSPSSREVEIYEMTMDDGTTGARPLPGPLEIPPGQTVTLRPEGELRLVFVGVNQPFAEGSEVAVTLTFERAGKIALKLPVLRQINEDASGTDPATSN